MNALKTVKDMTISLRPVEANDEQFLFEVYASTRRDEVSAWGWDRVQQDAFLKMQFTAQRHSYDLQHEAATHDIIILDGEPVGRLLVNRTSEEIHLVDIALLATTRGTGVGTALIKGLLDEGESKGLPVRLEVLKNNPAARLYERLGFKTTGESGLHLRMEKTPG